ncbi:TonB-dependent receptor [Porphyrobacter sp. HT-58-2]|uniref:TonB-dependent receptor n=1 Tax=Porphyrobacter sp. HT-58-2 TaxID=2023229 RepID=UPI001558A0DF|nr:TonB-dependent receptor [Porphyrobacter sp. HT-58-2]
MRNTIGLMTSVACLAVLLAAPAHAQQVEESGSGEQPAVADDQEEGRDIIVSGIRDSLRKAAQVKRDADQVIDVITAEDVGKLPDDNVAEALQRVTGVQITRVFGEGQAVNIRGLQQVRVEVDGRTLLGFSGRVSPPENDNLGRSSGLDSVPSSLFGRLEVAKSSIASQVEGGLGGTVNLKTPKPFDFKKPTIRLSARGTYSDESEQFEPAFQGLWTTTFGADDQFGILLSGEYQKRTSRLQLFERNNFLNRRNGDATATNRLAPLQLQYENVLIDRTRIGVSGAFQWKATDNLTLTADALYSRVANERFNQAVTFILPTNNNLNFRNPVFQEFDGLQYIVAAEATGRVRVQNQRRTDPTDNLLVGFNAAYGSDDGITIDVDAYYSRGTLRQEIEVTVLDTPNNIIGTFDFRNGTVPSLSLARPAGTPFSLTDPSVYNFPTTGNLTLRANQLPGNLEEYAARVDFGFEVSDGFKITAGARYVDLRADQTSFRSRGLATRDELTPFLVPGDPNFLDGIPGNFPREFATFFPDRDFLLDRVLSSEPGDGPMGFARNAPRDFDLREQTYTGYIMGNAEFDLLGMPAKFNAGVRVSLTDFEANTLTMLPGNMLVPTRDTNSFTNVLPSANLVVNVTDDFLVRIAASQTMQRAGLADLAPSTFINPTNLTSGGGNAQLTPPISTNFDISFEYYTGGSNLISAAVFYKDVEDAISVGTIQEDIIFEGAPLTVQTSRPFNIASAKVKGFEAGITQFLDFLPSPLDGLGVIANYTFADSEDSNGFPLVATSRHSYNLVALYEKGPVSARVAYNWRDDAVFEFTQGRPDVIAANAQLDAQIGIDLTKNVTLQLLGQNLLPRESATVEISNFNPIALNSYALSERRLSIGVRAKF